MDRVESTDLSAKSSTQGGPSTALVRAALLATMLALGIAALTHAARYVLLLINRTTLLHPWLAFAGKWLGVAAAVVAILATAGCAVMLTGWLIGRRAAAFAHQGLPDSRSAAALWLGCLLPPLCALTAGLTGAVVLPTSEHSPARWVIALALASCLLPLLALAWALVYVIELAQTEGRYTRLRQPIWLWWLAAMLSVAVSVFATLTSFAHDAQGIANNTVAATIAYLLALVAVAAAARVFDGFERRPVERPAHRWVIASDDGQAPEPSSAESLEPERQEPAA